MPATKPRRQPAETRRRQILDAAQQVFLRDGLQQATISDIADVAGLGKGTVYLHFESKGEVVAGLRRRYLEGIEAEVADRVAAAAGWRAKVAAFVTSVITASTRDPTLHHLLFQEDGIDEAEAFGPLRALLAEVVRQGAPAAGEGELAIDYALGGVHAGAIAVAHLPKSRRRAAVSAVVQLTLRTLGG